MKRRALRFTATATRLLSMLGTRLREAREKQGWTQPELARRMGLSEAYGYLQISHWENGRKAMSATNLVRAADALGASVDWLTGRVS